MDVKKITFFLLLPLLLLIGSPAFAQQVPPDTDDQDSCETAGSEFESLLLLILDTLEERKQERGVGDKSKDPHLFLPPFQALPGIGVGIPLSTDFVADLIPPLPVPAPPTVEVDNPVLLGLHNACETIEVDEDSN